MVTSQIEGLGSSDQVDMKKTYKETWIFQIFTQRNLHFIYIMIFIYFYQESSKKNPQIIPKLSKVAGLNATKSFSSLHQAGPGDVAGSDVMQLLRVLLCPALRGANITVYAPRFGRHIYVTVRCNNCNNITKRKIWFVEVDRGVI